MVTLSYYVLAYVMLVVQVAWIITWALGSYGVYLSFVSISSTPSSTHDGNGEMTTQVNLDPGQITAIICLFLSFHWTSETFKGILQSTVGGTIACWWFQPRRENVVRGALFRSVTTSFGSICLGGLLVAAVHTIRDILQVTTFASIININNLRSPRPYRTLAIATALHTKHPQLSVVLIIPNCYIYLNSSALVHEWRSR